jgi:hypothetical protein
MVRARLRSHLKALKERFPDLLGDCEIQEFAGTDYAFRLFVQKSAWVRVVAGLAEETEYDNFKSEVARHQGKPGAAYEHSLHAVWSVMHKLQESGGLSPVTAKQIDAILPFLERFEAADFSAGSWKTPEGQFPSFSFEDVVIEFHQALYDNGWVTPAFDWTEWRRSAQAFVDSPKKIERADATTIQKLLTTHVRANRFCEGHLASMFENGHIVALLRRLKTIRGQMKSDLRGQPWAVAQTESERSACDEDQMQAPNLFDFATSELSQDAFICWLASRADPTLKGRHEALHATATAFLNRLLEVGKGPKVSEYRSIAIRRQWKSIDVLLVINGDTAVIIEDKTDTQDHSDQLRRYKEAVAGEFPEGRIAAVYLKTGDQGDYRTVEQAGYGCFLRGDFLTVLDLGERAGVRNDIFADFHRYLQGVERGIQSFATVPLVDWQRAQWKGFFMALRQALGEGEWLHVGHAGGGSPAFRWHKRGDKFLRLDKGELGFKVEVGNEALRKARWFEWNRKLMAKGGTGGISIVTPRRRLGRRMTVAVLDGDYRQADERGLLDLPLTVETLRNAEALMDAALGVG